MRASAIRRWRRWCSSTTGLFALELFHGPTLAFKDMALQLLGRMFDHVLEKRGDARMTIIGATSGDTGSAAIEACRDRAADGHRHPPPKGPHELRGAAAPDDHGAGAERQATSRSRATFDACQDLVKAMFNDAPFRAEMRLSAVNSINWARIAAQIPYYAAAALALGAPDRAGRLQPCRRAISAMCSRPGRRAGWGCPSHSLIVGSNRNDILARFLAANDMSDAGRGAFTLAVDGHPGVERTSSGCCSNCWAATPHATAAGHGPLPRRGPHARPRCRLAGGDGPVPRVQPRRCRHARRDPPPLDRGRLPRGPAHGGRHGGGAGAHGSRCRHPAVAVVVAATAHPAKFPDAVERAPRGCAAPPAGASGGP
jgi:threonine synthase